MQTRKALRVFNKSADENKVSTDLSDSAKRFLKQYENTEKYIAHRKSQYDITLPFVETLKSKIAKITTESVDETMPVVGKFDIYSAIRKVADRSPSDRGLKRLSTQLEKSWRDDMSGSVSYGQLRSLVAFFKDQFPKSKAVDALQSECARLGYHKLPVAKLTRIASKIKNQADYDISMEVNGLAGDRPDQIKSREFIRALVERSANLAEENVADRRTAQERALDAMGSLEKRADLVQAMDKMRNAKELAGMLVTLLNDASADMFEDGLESDGQTLDSLANELESWVAQLNTIEAGAGGDPSLDSMPSSEVEQPVERRGPDVPLWDRKTLKGPSPSEKKLQQEEADLADSAGTSKKWWDPRTWSFDRMSRLLDGLDRAGSVLGNSQYVNALEKFAQLLPPPEDFVDEPGLDTPPVDDVMMDMSAPVDDAMMLPSDDMSSGEVSEGDLAQAVDMMRDVEEIVQEEAPPSVQNYMDHEMSEGHHTGLPGSSAWGAEEILFEDHSSAPPSDQWLAEEEAEIMGAPVSDVPAEMPLMAAKAAPGKLKLPGKPKAQPEVSGSHKKFGPKDAPKALRASSADIEKLLLAGRKVVAGKVKMFINDNDEIELWRGGSGRAASLVDMDIVIEDFRRMAQLEMAPPVSAPLPAPAMAPAAVGDLAGDEAAAQPSPVPLDETIKAALTNYRSQGMNFLEAMKEFNKEHGQRMEEWGPDADAMLISAARELWSGDVLDDIGALPAPAPAMPLAASAKSAAGMKIPKVRKPKDHVKPELPGKDTSQEDLPLPGKINQSVKPKGKMSDKELDKDTQSGHKGPSFGKPNAHPNDPSGKPGVKLPNKKLDKDLSQEDPFKVPSLGASPSVKKAQIKSELPPSAENDESNRTLVSTGDAHFLVVTDLSGTRIELSDDSGNPSGEIIAVVPAGHAQAVNDVMSGVYGSGQVTDDAGQRQDLPPLEVERGPMSTPSKVDVMPQKPQKEHLLDQPDQSFEKKPKKPIDI